MPRLTDDGKGTILGTVAAGWFVVLGMRFVVPALLPFVREEFTFSGTVAGVVVSVVWLTYALMQFPAGAMVDRIGERPLIAGSLLLGGVSMLVFYVAPSVGVFVLACALFGFGTGLFGSPRATILTRTFRENDGVAFGVVLAAGSLGAAGLPIVTTWVTEAWGWRSAFGLVAPLFLVLGVVSWLTLPEDGASGAVDVSVGAVRDAVANRAVVLAVVAITALLFALQGLTAFLPTYLVEQKGVSERTAATVYALLFVSGGLSQWLAGSAADRFGHHRVLLVVSAVSVLPLVALPFVDGLLALSAVALALGVRLATGPVSNGYIVRLLAEEVQGTAWGLLRTTFFVVGSLGSVVVGAMADAQLFDAAFLLLAALTGFAAVVYVFLPRRSQAL
ncbi:MFS transporter [Halomarina oriensis]|uniref:MFS transporter n=1 Tax=Halomarina oriensis TaxID=671145 RepID=A0A6B0GPJ9_9EURY|nr:MFS transporter [Halomarina oriensis]